MFAGWILLSCKKPCTASTERNEFKAANLTNENVRSFWVAGTNAAGQWATIDLLREYDVKAFQVNYTDYQSDIFSNDGTVYLQFKMLHSREGQRWELLADFSKVRENRPNLYYELPAPVKTRYIRFENVHVPTPNLALSDIRIFGNGSGAPTATPANLRVERHPDARDATIRWEAVPGAVGYNILWGIGRDKLYQTYQVWVDAGQTLELRALNLGQDYYFAIEAFNENGVSKPGGVMYVK